VKTNYLRVTNWSHPAEPSMTAVVDGADLKSEDPYDAVESHLDAGFFVTYEIFEGDKGEAGFFAAMKHAAERAAQEERRERDMAIGYFWYADALRITTPDGVVASTRPVPFPREDMAWVMRSLSRHENYKGQTITVPLQDGTTITMRKGEVLPA
jgi:hypothetical protein